MNKLFIRGLVTQKEEVMKNLVFTLFLVVTFISNVQSQTKEIPNGLINGTWSRTVTTPPTTYTLFFSADSTFSFTNPANDASFSHKCQFNGDVITFPAIGCSVEGKYKFIINGDELIFQLEKDSCKDRIDAMVGIWTSIKKENE
jgi:hypothetical protein